ncbi:multidrug effflux MFS transporter [Devosia sp. XJ19-1]|uniref:Bcr/CflA family efflux transporter n=1 Tax=Devosia ureilytica TaxID=2952754 RepID=A0A9Q4FV64_9HYPH|nr:multidrug effflux MFS transporter [Devosia ureilytica]MCP8885051.1 multidrug effflux MFS transporter [Devosia ureilytica]MCP8889029.1 multidrug effflux MFS transporter [Devosia ureilytica]
MALIMSGSSASPRLFTLVFLSALAILPINFFLPSLPQMAAEFGVDYGLMGLSLAAYAIVSACLQLVLGPLSDRFGRRPVILGALTIFIAATIGCALAPDAWTFLACRMVQAVIAPTYGVALAVIRDTTTREQSASRFGYLAMAWAVAPMLGPTAGGLLDQLFGWRASFCILALFGIAVLALCWTDLRETNTSRSMTMLEQYKAYTELLGSRRFLAYCLCMAFSVGAFYAFLAGAPLAASAFDLSPAVLGLYMGSITAGFMLGSFLAARLAGKLPQANLLIAGRIVACAGLLFGIVLYFAGVEHVAALFGPCFFVGLSNGLTQPSANAAAMSVRATQMGSAAGLAGAITVAGASIMAAIAGAVLTEENARSGLLMVMLASAIAALGAALFARHLETDTPQTT